MLERASAPETTPKRAKAKGLYIYSTARKRRVIHKLLHQGKYRSSPSATLRRLFSA